MRLGRVPQHPSPVDLHLLHVVAPFQVDQHDIRVIPASDGWFGTVTVIVYSPERMRCNPQRARIVEVRAVPAGGEG